MNGQRFHQQKRIEMKTEQGKRSLNRAVVAMETSFNDIVSAKPNHI